MAAASAAAKSNSDCLSITLFRLDGARTYIMYKGYIIQNSIYNKAFEGLGRRRTKGGERTSLGKKYECVQSELNTYVHIFRSLRDSVMNFSLFFFLPTIEICRLHVSTLTCTPVILPKNRECGTHWDSGRRTVDTKSVVYISVLLYLSTLCSRNVCE